MTEWVFHILAWAVAAKSLLIDHMGLYCLIKKGDHHPWTMSWEFCSQPVFQFHDRLGRAVDIDPYDLPIMVGYQYPFSLLNPSTSPLVSHHILIIPVRWTRTRKQRMRTTACPTFARGRRIRRAPRTEGLVKLSGNSGFVGKASGEILVNLDKLSTQTCRCFSSCSAARWGYR